jgi:hypothetical protein
MVSHLEHADYPVATGNLYFKSDKSELQMIQMILCYREILGRCCIDHIRAISETSACPNSRKFFPYNIFKTLITAVSDHQLLKKLH